MNRSPVFYPKKNQLREEGYHNEAGEDYVGGRGKLDI